MAKKITAEGNPLTLAGEQIRVGENAPEFKAVDGSMNDVTLAAFKGKIKIITTFPSIDTSVCNLQVKAFNERASQLGDDVVIVGVSMDLPFAQGRFCETYKIGNVILLSDYKYHEFAEKYGLLVEELQLLARTVIIVDKNNTVRYVQIVDEITSEPDYDDVLKNLKSIV